MVSNLGQMPYESEFGKLKLGANSPAGTRQRTERLEPEGGEIAKHRDRAV
jgi:hypothetical protein